MRRCPSLIDARARFFSGAIGLGTAQLTKPLGYYTKKHPDRDDAIRQAYATGGYGMKEMGEHFGLHYSRVSRIIARAGKAKGKI